MADVLYGFDSSLSHFGYAVAMRVDGRLRVKALGVYSTESDDSSKTKTADTARRMEFIARQLFVLVTKHGPPAGIACEALAVPFGKTSMVTQQRLGRARGLVDAMGALHLQPAVDVQAQQLKRLVAGNVSASKADVINAVRRMYPEAAKMFDSLSDADNVEHAADAVGALHAVFAGKAGA